MDNLTPMMRQYHEIKRENPDVLLLFRLGDFYEMFFEDAVTGSRELEITLTSRHADRSGKPIPMCGVPYHAVNGYLSKLIKKGHRVAICEQVEDPKQAKGLVRREITRIVTPGTAVEDALLESRENNFIGAILESSERVGASFLDVSTGEFWITELAGDQAREQMLQVLSHFNPRELVVADGDRTAFEGWYPADLRANTVLTGQPDWSFNLDYSQRLLLDHFKVSTLEGFGLDGQQAGIGAAGALMNYVKQTQRSQLGHVLTVRLFELSNYMKLDEATVRNLELLKTNDGSRQWTLLSVLDSTKTGMGARLLRSWLLRPSLDVRVINERLDSIEELKGSLVRMDRIGKVLKAIHDVERLLSRVVLETANARDLLALRDSLASLPELQTHLADCKSSLLSTPLDLLTDVVSLLQQSIDEDAPVTLNDGGMIRRGIRRGVGPAPQDLRIGQVIYCLAREQGAAANRDTFPQGPVQQGFRLFH